MITIIKLQSTMKKHITLITVFILSLFVTPLNAQETIAGITLDKTATYAGKNLQLNGGGLREKLWIDLYVAGLYVTTKSKNGTALAEANDPITLKMHIVSGLISSEKMSSAVEEGFEKSTGGNVASLRSRIDKFKALFMQEDIVKGNIFEFAYDGNNNLNVMKNGKKIGSIEGNDFKTALFKQWLGENPVDEVLKAGLLKG